MTKTDKITKQKHEYKKPKKYPILRQKKNNPLYINPPLIRLKKKKIKKISVLPSSSKLLF